MAAGATTVSLILFRPGSVAILGLEDHILNVVNADGRWAETHVRACSREHCKVRATYILGDTMGILVSSGNRHKHVLHSRWSALPGPHTIQPIAINPFARQIPTPAPPAISPPASPLPTPVPFNSEPRNGEHLVRIHVRLNLSQISAVIVKKLHPDRRIPVVMAHFVFDGNPA